MVAQVYYALTYVVETNHGTEFINGEEVGMVGGVHAGELIHYLEGNPLNRDEFVTPKKIWLSRLSMPGYMDRTDWVGYESEQEAIEGLIRLYGDGDDQEDWEKECLEHLRSKYPSSVYAW